MRIESAQFRCFRLYDVADGLDLERARALVKDAGERLKLKREGSEYLQLASPPLSVELGTRQLLVAGAPREVRLSARLFHYGAVSVCVRVPVPSGATLEALVPLADELYESPQLDALCLEAVERLRGELTGAFDDPHLWAQHEAYTVLFVTALEGAPTAEAVLAEPALARVVMGESKEPALSPAEEREVLQHAWSYTTRDLAVVEWNAALVLEPSGSEDLVDLLELANAQLLELRYYDAVLDEALARVNVAVGRRRPGSLFLSPYQRLLRELTLTLIELSEFIERIENALKIVGDVYLARVYEGAVKQLRIPRWTEQVSRKHRLLKDTYSLLKGEVDTGRALSLEVAVVVLILVELVLAVVRAGGH